MSGPSYSVSEAAAYLAAVVDSSQDAIITKNLSGVIQTWNKAAEHIFGYTAQEAVGQQMLLIIPPELHHEEASILERLRNGDRIEHFETVRRNRLSPRPRHAWQRSSKASEMPSWPPTSNPESPISIQWPSDCWAVPVLKPSGSRLISFLR